MKSIAFALSLSLAACAGNSEMGPESLEVAAIPESGAGARVWQSLVRYQDRFVQGIRDSNGTITLSAFGADGIGETLAEVTLDSRYDSAALLDVDGDLTLVSWSYDGDKEMTIRRPLLQGAASVLKLGQVKHVASLGHALFVLKDDFSFETLELDPGAGWVQTDQGEGIDPSLFDRLHFISTHLQDGTSRPLLSFLETGGENLWIGMAGEDMEKAVEDPCAPGRILSHDIVFQGDERVLGFACNSELVIERLGSDVQYVMTTANAFAAMSLSTTAQGDIIVAVAERNSDGSHLHVQLLDGDELSPLADASVSLNEPLRFYAELVSELTWNQQRFALQVGGLVHGEIPNQLLFLGHLRGSSLQ